jgi:hypothetical protein
MRDLLDFGVVRGVGAAKNTSEYSESMNMQRRASMLPKTAARLRAACVRTPVAAGVYEAEYDLLFGRIHARLLHNVRVTR